MEVRLQRVALTFVHSIIADKGGIAALEFAMVGPILILLILFTFEVSYDLFVRSMLDTALQAASRQIQTGNAQNAQGGSDFISRYVCPNLAGILDCSKVYVRVQQIAPSGTQDFFDFALDAPPSSGSNLDLSSFASSSYCNPGPSQMVVVNAIYVSPSIVYGLLPGVSLLQFNGLSVHATLSGVGLVTEGFPPAVVSQGASPRC